MIIIKHFVLKFFVVLSLAVIFVSPAYAQSQDDYRLGISKTFGFASGDQVRGTFTLYLTGSTNIKSVQYLVDGELIGTASTAPYNLTFQTTSFPNGFHDISAIVETNEGKSVTLPVRRFEFISADQETSGTLNILIPIVAVVILVVLLVAGVQVLFLRNKFATLAPGTPRKYGIRGGTICPRCHRPYSIHLWAGNLVTYRLDRCDYCGKWAFVRPYSMDALRAAEKNEATETAAATVPEAKSDEDKLRELIEKSKYTDQ